jgi:hypothetical protein
MTLKSRTRWTPASGRGYMLTSGTPPLQTQQGIDLQTQGGLTLNVNSVQYQPVYTTSWLKADNHRTSWEPILRYPAINYLLVTNAGQNLVTNSGQNIITSTGAGADKYLTQWSETGA